MGLLVCAAVGYWLRFRVPSGHKIPATGVVDNEMTDVILPPDEASFGTTIQDFSSQRMRAWTVGLPDPNMRHAADELHV